MKAFIFGLSDWSNQQSQNYAFHVGLVLGELLCDIIYSALRYNSNSVFIDASCSTGNIPIAAIFEHLTPDEGIEILSDQFQFATKH